MNRYLTDRDRKLLGVVTRKIIDKQVEIRGKSNAVGIHQLERELDLKDAGLSIALSIIGDMVWKEDEDYFRGFKEEQMMDTYNLMEVKSNSIEQSCYACPTIFEWIDKYNKKYYFRLRHGYWHIVDESADTVIVSGISDDGSDGMCSWEDAKRYAVKEKFIIVEI